MPFKLATMQTSSGARAAVIVGDIIYDLANVTGRQDHISILQILERWDINQPMLLALSAVLDPAQGQPLADVTLLPPVMYPPAVYCAGSNYADHVANMERKLGIPPGPDPRANGARPFHFLKASRCCVGTGAKVRAPSPMLDWEGELVAVIGTEARRVTVDNALSYVAGYMVGNDLSARDIGFRHQLPATSIFHHSFMDHKGFADSAPTGPWIVPATEVPNPHQLLIRTEVNGVVKQNGSTSGMIFSLEEQIAYLSSIAPLFPGDIIMTGTPAGTGAENGEFLKPGDCVAITIEGLGTLTTQIV